MFLLKAILDESPWPAGAALGALAFGPGLTVEFGLMRLAVAAPATIAHPAAGGAADAARCKRSRTMTQPRNTVLILQDSLRLSEDAARNLIAARAGDDS